MSTEITMADHRTVNMTRDMIKPFTQAMVRTRLIYQAIVPAAPESVKVLTKSEEAYFVIE